MLTATNSTYKQGRDTTDNPPNALQRKAEDVVSYTPPVPSIDLLCMKVEKNRLDSFKNENWRCRFMDAGKFAKHGFFYTGINDHVRCAFCKVEIGKWEEGDDVTIDHQRWAPRCPFLRGYDVGNVPLDPSERTTQPKPQGHDTCGALEIRPNSGPESASVSASLGINSNEDIALSRLGVHQNTGPSFKNYSTYESRLRSFKEWPRGMKQRPEQLAEAGFFYTGKGDQTLCFHCGGGLKDWIETDEPWEQHAKWFSKCTFVIYQKGSDFVRNACARDPPVISPELARELATARTEVEQPVETSALEAPQKQDTPAEDFRLCKICYTEQLGVLFLPCGHIVACVKCAPSLSTCAICRQPFTATVRAFLP